MKVKPYDVGDVQTDAHGTPYVKVYFAYQDEAEKWANDLDFKLFGRRSGRFTGWFSQVRKYFDR